MFEFSRTERALLRLGGVRLGFLVLYVLASGPLYCGSPVSPFAGAFEPLEGLSRLAGCEGALTWYWNCFV